ncbi:MAG TPA: TolC family protein [Allosphingosinicella sp.]|nr:TolC family protein [Allosphingosinicella sp.]
MTMKHERGLAAAGALCLTLSALVPQAPALGQAPEAPVARVAPPFRVLAAQVEGAAPTLEIGSAEVRAAQGRALQAGARPNPTVRVEVENFLGTRPYGGFGAAETTVAGELPLELGGKRAARVAAARAEVAAAEARAGRGRTDYLRDLAIAYGEAEAAQAKERLAVEHLRLAHSDAQTARILVENGREAPLRAVQADSATAAAIAEVEEAVAVRAGALGRLSALAGSAEGYTAVAGGLLDGPEELRLPGRGAQAAIAVATAERDALAAKVRSERVRRQPDLNVGVGLRRFEQEGAFAAIAGVSATIPLFDRNRGNVAAARAELSAAEARLRQASLSAQADRRSTTAQAEAAESRVEAALAGERASAEAYRLARIGYDSGRIAMAEVLTTRTALVEARERLVDARLARVRAEAELARAQGAIQ